MLADLIGGSWGGYMAYAIALAARRLSLAPRRLSLLDPLPPVAGKAPDVIPAPMRVAIRGMLVFMLVSGGAAAVGGI